MDMLIEIFMFLTPSVQICDWSQSNIKNYENEKLLKGNLFVSKGSKPLNNPLVSTKIAYEAQFLRYFNLLKNSIGKKETK